MRPVLLDEMLGPLWKLLRFSGIQHGFLGAGDDRRPAYILRCLSTVSIAMLFLCFICFSAGRFATELLNGQELIKVAYWVMLLSTNFNQLIIVLQCCYRYDQLVNFLKDWRVLEMATLQCSNRKRTIAIAITSFVFICITIIISSGYLIASLCFHFASGRDLDPDWNYNFIEGVLGAIYNYYEIIFHCMSEMLPAFFFYQAGCFMENLQVELERLEPPAQPGNIANYHCVWRRYQSACGLVSRANSLFGYVMIANQFFSISYFCLCVYLMSFPEDNSMYRVELMLVISVCLMRTIFVYWMISHLYLSCCRLRERVADLMSRKWLLMSQDHRDLLNCFLSRLDRDDVAAAPWSWFSITPSSFLALVALKVNYSLLLFQSN